MTTDLFGAPILPGLHTQPDLVDTSEEQMLIQRIDATELTPFRFQGWTGKRLTTSFGWAYDFEVGQPIAAPPIPDWLLPFRARAANLAKLDPSDLIQALLIRYDPGAGTGIGRSTVMSWEYRSERRR